MQEEKFKRQKAADKSVMSDRLDRKQRLDWGGQSIEWRNQRREQRDDKEGEEGRSGGEKCHNAMEEGGGKGRGGGKVQSVFVKDGRR